MLGGLGCGIPKVAAKHLVHCFGAKGLLSRARDFPGQMEGLILLHSTSPVLPLRSNSEHA